MLILIDNYITFLWKLPFPITIDHTELGRSKIVLPRDWSEKPNKTSWNFAVLAILHLFYQKSPSCKSRIRFTFFLVTATQPRLRTLANTYPILTRLFDFQKSVITYGLWKDYFVESLISALDCWRSNQFNWYFQRSLQFFYIKWVGVNCSKFDCSTLLSSVSTEKVNFWPIKMVNNFICRTCSLPKLPFLT